MSPPAKDATSPLFDARQQRDAEVHRRVLLLGQRDVEVAGAHHADLARAEAQVECLAVLGARVLVHVAGLDHVARPLQHLLDAVALERLVIGVLRLDRGAARPHQRADGEDVAAGAGARQEIALHVAAERGDLVGIFADLGEAGRRLLRIEAGLAEQVLVPEQRRDVGIERHAVEPALIGRDRHVAGARGLQLGPVLDLVGDVDQLPGRLELRAVDQVHAHQVGHLAAGDRLRDLRHHLGMRDVGQVDLAIGVLLRSTPRRARRPCRHCRRCAPTSACLRPSPETPPRRAVPPARSGISSTLANSSVSSLLPIRCRWFPAREKLFPSSRLVSVSCTSRFWEKLFSTN